MTVEGSGLEVGEPVTVGPLRPGEASRLEVGVAVGEGAATGDTLEAEVVVDGAGGDARHAFEIVVAEPGWTDVHGPALPLRPGLVEHAGGLHRDVGRRDSRTGSGRLPAAGLRPRQVAPRDWRGATPTTSSSSPRSTTSSPTGTPYPEDRDVPARAARRGPARADGRHVQRAEHQPDRAPSRRSATRSTASATSATSSAATRNRLAARRVRSRPAVPGLMADAGLTSSLLGARAVPPVGPDAPRPPRRRRGCGRPRPRCSSRASSTGSHQAGGRAHELTWPTTTGPAGGWTPRPTLDAPRPRSTTLFTRAQAPLAATQNVLLPVGTDYTPPNKWVTADPPRLERALCLAEVRLRAPARILRRRARRRSAERPPVLAADARHEPDLHGQGRVVHRHQAGPARRRVHAARRRRSSRTIARLLGARYPDRGDRQGVAAAHATAPTTTASPAPSPTRSTSTCLAAGARHSSSARARSTARFAISGRPIDTSGDGVAVTVFNALSWPRTDLARVGRRASRRVAAASSFKTTTGAIVPFALESVDGGADGEQRRATIAFLRRDVPALGYRTFRLLPADAALDDAGVARRSTHRPSRTSVPGRRRSGPGRRDRQHRRQAHRRASCSGPARSATSCAHTAEYPNHPLFEEGPWHLTPDGRSTSAVDFPRRSSSRARRSVSACRVEGPFEDAAPHTGDHAVGRRRAGRADDRAHDYRSARPPVPGPLPGCRCEGGRRSPRSATLSSAGRSAARTSTSPRPRSRSTIRPTTGSGSGRPRASRSADAVGAADARASRAIGIAEVVARRSAHDDAVRELVVALVRQGVTSTSRSTTAPLRRRSHIDSNLPDVRIAVGGPTENDVRGERARRRGRRLSRTSSSGSWPRRAGPASGSRRTATPSAVAEPITDLRGAARPAGPHRRRRGRRGDDGRHRCRQRGSRRRGSSRSPSPRPRRRDRRRSTTARSRS